MAGRPSRRGLADEDLRQLHAALVRWRRLKPADERFRGQLLSPTRDRWLREVEDELARRNDVLLARRG